MANLSMLPLTSTLVALATQTTSGTSSALTLPNASSFRFVLQVQTVSGTSPTLQVIVATSFDAGTTYNEFISFANVTTSGQGRQLTWRPYMSGGDLATFAAASTLGTADLGAADIATNGPFNPALIKVRWVLTGTSPSFAFQLQFAAVPQNLDE